MSLIKCEACENEISRDSKVCSKCGHPTKKSLAHHKKLENEKAIRENPIGTAISFGLILLVVFGLVTCMGSSKDKPKERSFGQADALTMCQFAMKAASKFPDKAEIPYTSGTSDSAGFGFSWGAGTEHMMWMNGFGMMVPTSGSCYVNKTTKSITMLTVNGQTVI